MYARMLLLLLTLFAAASIPAPIGTTFTYQGELQHAGQPANGLYDFQFELFDVDVGGVALDIPVLAEDVSVADGVFSVELDFGAAFFAGDQVWLEISVREGSSSSGYTGLLPRQKITAVPYALHAEFLPMGSIGVAEVDPNQIQIRVADPCPPDSSIRSIDIGGNIECEADTDTVNLDASNLIAGTLDPARYDAYAGLTVGGRLDNNDTLDLLTRGQSDGRYLPGNCIRRESAATALDSWFVSVTAHCAMDEVAVSGGYDPIFWTAGTQCIPIENAADSSRLSWTVDWAAASQTECAVNTTKTFAWCCKF
ncbi:MAG: hypothetical protein QNJ40_10245 [Xanthomonadales bacterium]|nr:hypothetical protein [Xanthomonadales bacterium]